MNSASQDPSGYGQETSGHGCEQGDEPDGKAAARSFPDRPLVGVAAVVFRDEHVLLVRRANPPRQGEWSLPGGLQRLGETVAAAARREVMEETGVEVHVIGVVEVVDLIERDGREGAGPVERDGQGSAAPVRWHYTLIELAAAWRAGEAVAGEDASDAAWFALDRVPALGLWSETERVIGLAHRRWIEAGRPEGTGRSTGPGSSH